MSFGIRPQRTTRWLVAVALLVLLSAGAVSAQETELVVRVNDTTAYPGEQNAVISIYMSNYFDTVAAFNMWVMLDRPDIMVFQTEVDTLFVTTYWDCLEWDEMTCIDSIMVSSGGDWDFYYTDTMVALWGNLDTTGTLVSGWDYVIASSLGGMGYDLNIVAIANGIGQPPNKYIPPQEDGLLIKMLADVYNIPDTMTDRTVNILIQTEMAEHFCFSNLVGQCIGGFDWDTLCDTTYWLCTQWAGDVCLNWIQVSSPPYDSITVECDSVIVGPGEGVVTYNGSLTVRPTALIGDVDCDGQINIADLVYLVCYMFQSGSPLECLENADCDENGDINIADVICFVQWMFPPQ
ncbi:MAG: dockerin type I repeat-containing protein [candidate division Zixibacteria bacterium]|nr:dockerin type I repeat-containing protein [candidate division Zixibacteria bacterium]